MIRALLARLFGRRRRGGWTGPINAGRSVCPNCIFIWEGDEVIEVIDCQSNLHHKLNEHGWQGPLTGYTNEGEEEKP